MMATMATATPRPAPRPTPGPPSTPVPWSATIPPARLALREPGSTERLVDGAWWPRSWDLSRELPGLADALDPLGGRITRVALSSRRWADIPSEPTVNGHPVRVHRLPAGLAEDRIVVMAQSTGRWNLLVVPPLASAATAARLMIAASGA